ncbi:hypothetical protein ACJX0J_011550, partial [Zea mays]
FNTRLVRGGVYATVEKFSVVSIFSVVSGRVAIPQTIPIRLHEVHCLLFWPYNNNLQWTCRKDIARLFGHHIRIWSILQNNRKKKSALLLGENCDMFLLQEKYTWFNCLTCYVLFSWFSLQALYHYHPQIGVKIGVLADLVLPPAFLFMGYSLHPLFLQ